MTGNIPESGLSNVIVRAGSLALTTFASMPKRYMSTKRYLVTLWLLLVLAFNAKFERIVCDHRVGGLALAPRVAKEATVVVTAGICQRPVLDPLHLRWSEMTPDEGHRL